VSQLKILFVRLSAFGDVIQTLPALSAVRRDYPRARLHWLVAAKCAELLQDNPDLDRVHVFSATPGGFLRMGRELRREQFDVAIDFQGLLKSGLLTWLSGAPRRLGRPPRSCREPLSAFFTNEWVPLRQAHVIHQYLELVKPLGVGDGALKFSLALPEVDAPGVFRARPVALHVGGGWESKRYAPEKWGEVARQITEVLHCPLVVFWGPGDEERAAAVKRLAPRSHLAPRVTYPEMGRLLTHCALLVCVESGPMHLAGAVGTPVICLVSLTDPRRSGPWDRRSRVILPPPPHQWSTRRTGASPANLIPEAQVVDAVREMLEEMGAGPFPF
jgi:ADP-heptose:LPS heptosyltransferase